MENPTEKQLQRIKRLIDYTGRKFVEDYFNSKYPQGDLDNLTKTQAQKIITGLQTYEKRKPILGVVGRDAF